MDAAEIRRRSRIKKRLSKGVWVLWILIVAMVGTYLFWRSQLIETARIVSDEFMSKVSKGELESIQTRLLSEGLKANLPDRRFFRQMALLSRKLGHLEEFHVTDSELSWDNRVVRLVYKASFSRGPARVIFEVIPDKKGYWRLDTFLFWADNWQEL